MGAEVRDALYMVEVEDHLVNRRFPDFARLSFR
jgi:hypothetical protein